MVIAALAIMAGIVIPQVSGAVDDAKQGTMLHDLRELTNAIERYRMDHAGIPPDQHVAGTLPQLTSKTNVDGDIGVGPEYIYGPYLHEIPVNPLNEVTRVFRVNSAPPANLSSRVGWVYHPASGQIWAGLFVGAGDELLAGGGG